MRAGGWRNRRAGGVRQIRGSCGRWTKCWRGWHDSIAAVTIANPP